MNESSGIYTIASRVRKGDGIHEEVIRDGKIVEVVTQVVITELGILHPLPDPEVPND